MNILERFKKANKGLVKLDPEICVEYLLEEVDHETREVKPCNPPKPEIMVIRPFLFDKRMIPETFEGIVVRDIITGDYPKEFPTTDVSWPMEEYFAPERYEAFVDRNIAMIREKLYAPALTKAGALDALTGNFDEHVKMCNALKAKRLEESQVSLEFFRKLLKDTKNAFLSSDVQKLQEGKRWGYAVTATLIQKGKPLIVGFNWGVNKELAKEGKGHGAQVDYPLSNFEGNYYELGSLKRIIPFLYEYYPPALAGMQTNYCFFRSERENQISEKDLELSQALFESYLEYSQPSTIISFSNRLRSYLETSGQLFDINQREILSGKRTIRPMQASLRLKSGMTVKFVYLPHPNYPLKKEAREQAWKFCFPEVD